MSFSVCYPVFMFSLICIKHDLIFLYLWVCCSYDVCQCCRVKELIKRGNKQLRHPETLNRSLSRALALCRSFSFKEIAEVDQWSHSILALSYHLGTAEKPASFDVTPSVADQEVTFLNPFLRCWPQSFFLLSKDEKTLKFTLGRQPVLLDTTGHGT